MSIIPHGPVRSVLALVLGLGIGIGLYLLASQWEGSIDYAKGRDMPGMELQTLGGGQRSLAMLTTEQPAVIAVFSSWCKYCKPVMRALNEFYPLAAQENVGVYAVNYGEKPEVVQGVVASMGLVMPVFLDEDMSFAESMGLDGIPVVFGVAQGGEIRYIEYALPPEREWPSFIESLR